MKQGAFYIERNTGLGPVFCLKMAGDTAAVTAPGQFVDLRIGSAFLRRPISVCDWDERSVTLLYKIVGDGTRALSSLREGAKLDVLTGLGNGFRTSVSGDTPLLVGGGVGIAPLYRLAKDLTAQGKRPTVVLGYRSLEEIFFMEEFHALGAEVIVTTEDGSFGVPGLVTDGVARAGAYTYVYACGPKAMLRALDAVAEGPGQYSFEERMGCGFGACMGCTIQTKNGYKRVCRDGPVFSREEVLW